MEPTIGRDVHRQILAEVREQRKSLEKQLAELQAVERFHAEKAGESTGDQAGDDSRVHWFGAGRRITNNKVSTATSQPEKNITKHDLAALALRQIGRPAKVGEICDQLDEIGLGNSNRRVFFNGIYTALKRREDMFEKLNDSYWKLRDNAHGEAPLNGS